MARSLWAAQGVVLRAAAALVVVLALSAASPAAAEVVATPLTLQSVVDAFKRHITNWPEFAAANNLTGWGGDPAVPPCLYTGVTCDSEGALQSLALACPQCDVKAEGSLAPELAQSRTLQTVNLQQNEFEGGLPPEYGARGAFPGLLHLVLSSNRLNGSIPDEWSDPSAFPRMTLLGLSGNRLTGALPEYWALPALLIMRAQNNLLSGPLPRSWGTNESMPAARVLSLQGNQLTGEVPAEWARPEVMPALEEVYLQGNQLTGGLPGEWGSWDMLGLPALRVLNLSHNPLGGTLPPEWSRQQALPSLHTLVLSHTGLEGTLPASWNCLDPSRCGLPLLQALWLDGNNLTGPVPPSWSSLSGLQALFVRPGNEQLCVPAGVDFPFRLCDASGVDCPEPVEMERCSPSLDCPFPAGLAPCPEEEPLAPRPEGAAPAPSSGEVAAASGGGGADGGGGSPVGAIVGGTLGGLAAALAALLLVRWRRRRWKRNRELPFYVDPANKPPFHDAYAGPPDLQPSEGLLPTPDTPPGRGGVPGDPGMPASPFAAVAADLEAPSPRPSADYGRAEPRSGHRRQGSDASGNSFFQLLLGMAAGKTTPLQGAKALAPLEDSQAQSVELMQRSGTTPPSKDDSASSQNLQWEESVPLSDWQIVPSEIQIAKRPDGSDWELGTGGFGKVYKALRHGAQPVAVKVLAAVGESTRYQSQEDFKREIGILRACRDPNIVAFLGASLQADRTMLVTEYCDGGNLTRNLMAGRVTWYRRGRKIALDVARGLAYLHSRRIIHFDLKSPNILLARDGTAKISDVGMAKIMAREYSGITGNVGTLAWAAPEMLLGTRCTEKADIYSFGVVLWEIATVQTPIRGQLRDVKVPEECPAVARELILDCLATNPRKRPTAVEIAARLAAMPDLRPPPGAPTRQPSRRLFRPTAPAPAGPAESTAAAGLASRGEMALVPGDFAAAAAAVQLRAEERQARHGLPCSQRSSEESNMSMILPEESTLAAAYASPVPGTAAALPLPAATHGGSAGLPAGALDAAAAPLLQQPLETGAPLAPGRLYRASSSTPRAGLGAEPQGSPPSGGTDSGGGEGHLPSPAHTDQPAPHAAPAGAVHPESSGDEPSPFASPAAQRQLGPRPPRPAFNRAASLDDPGRQLAELRQSGMQPAGQPGPSQLVQLLAALQQGLRRTPSPRLEQVMEVEEREQRADATPGWQQRLPPQWQEPVQQQQQRQEQQELAALQQEEWHSLVLQQRALHAELAARQLEARQALEREQGAARAATEERGRSPSGSSAEEPAEQGQPPMQPQPVQGGGQAQPLPPSTPQPPAVHPLQLDSEPELRQPAASAASADPSTGGSSAPLFHPQTLVGAFLQGSAAAAAASPRFTSPFAPAAASSDASAASSAQHAQQELPHELSSSPGVSRQLGSQPPTHTQAPSLQDLPDVPLQNEASTAGPSSRQPFDPSSSLPSPFDNQ